MTIGPDSGIAHIEEAPLSVKFPAKVTVPAGGEFIVSANSCLTLPPFHCPPDALLIDLMTLPPASNISGYTLEAWLISDTTGETIPMGTNFPFWISTDVTTEEQIGIFGYAELAQDFPFPTDPGFFGNTPQASTFSVKFQKHRSSVHVLDGAPRERNHRS